MEFKESHEEVTFSKLHKSTKPEKNNMYHKRRKEASNTGYTMVKEVQMEKGLFHCVHGEMGCNWGQEWEFFRLGMDISNFFILLKTWKNQELSPAAETGPHCGEATGPLGAKRREQWPQKVTQRGGGSSRPSGLTCLEGGERNCTSEQWGKKSLFSDMFTSEICFKRGNIECLQYIETLKGDRRNRRHLCAWNIPMHTCYKYYLNHYKLLS